MKIKFRKFWDEDSYWQIELLPSVFIFHSDSEPKNVWCFGIVWLFFGLEFWFNANEDLV